MATVREVKKRIRTVKSTSEISITALALFLFVTSSSFGFDGNRKGFVLGGGLGVGVTAGWSGSVYNSSTLQFVDTSESAAGPGFNLLIGHGWNNKNLMVFEFNFSDYQSEVFGQSPRIAQGFAGGVWYHFFKPADRSFFTAVGMGMYRFVVYTSNWVSQDLGTAIIWGGGYEFARHFLIGTYFVFGRISADIEGRSYHNLNILLTAFAF